MMSRHKQPGKLGTMALNKLGDWVALQATALMPCVPLLVQRDSATAQTSLSQHIDVIRNYLDYNVPWLLHDMLFHEVIRALSDLLEQTERSIEFRGEMGKFVSQMNVIVRMTEILFTKKLTMLSIEAIPKKFRSTFYTKLYMLTGLVQLNLGSLSGGWKTTDMEFAIVNALKELHSLKYLSINYDCTDIILRCIQENCKLIEKLDVLSSKCISNESIDILTKLERLRSVQLYRTSVTVEGFVKLLLYCKNIEDIGRCDDIGKVLEYINLLYTDKQFKLTTYVSRYASWKQLQLSVQMCPCIRNMTVFHTTLHNDLMVLIGLQDLSQLKLLSCDFYADQVKQLLQVKGCNIVNLHLEHVDQIDLNALMYISQFCPLLQTLTLYNCYLVQHTSLYTKKLQIPPFRNLKKLTFVSSCTDEQLLFVLTNCVNADFVHIGTAVHLTDELVFKILDNNPLLSLKELRIMQSDFLTMLSVDRIIQSCISLEIFVELESWAALSETDRDYIRNYIKVNNYNIDTAPIRMFDV